MYNDAFAVPSVDLDQPRWFVCSANPQRMLHSLRGLLDKLKIEYYMAIRLVLRKKRQELIEEEESCLGSFFFIRSTLRQALALKFDHGLDYQYVRDGKKQLLWVPDKQMSDFMMIIESMKSYVNYNANLYAVGDTVIVSRGPLCGVCGTLVELGKRDYHLLLKVPGVLAISVKIAKSNVRKV